MRLPWFRVHIVLLNDPGRLLAVHLMHTALVAGWSGAMVLYEQVVYDPSDPVFNPCWRQGWYASVFASRLGVVHSLSGWSLASSSQQPTSVAAWCYELVGVAHILLAGLLVLAAFWHWLYWDLDVFLFGNTLALDLPRLFGLHLILAALACAFFGALHLSGLCGPGMWTSDSAGLLGSIRALQPVYAVPSLSPANYGVIASHHLIAGLLGTLIGFWHCQARPTASLMQTLQFLTALFLAAILSVATVWYGAVTAPVELQGSTRYHWDMNTFANIIAARVRAFSASAANLTVFWDAVPDKLVLYDYLGTNPAKGGLFRQGPCIKGDGVVQSWLGHVAFAIGALPLTVRRMPAFFETFPVLLIDEAGSLRADIPFRRAESAFSIEERSVVLSLAGGVLSGSQAASPSVVKAYARKGPFGEVLGFSGRASLADGVFRTSIRGWYAFSHLALAGTFFFGHLWHAGRGLYRELWTGLRVLGLEALEYGRNDKLGSAGQGL